jgi:hypothetical protein
MEPGVNKIIYKYAIVPRDGTSNHIIEVLAPQTGLINDVDFQLQRSEVNDEALQLWLEVDADEKCPVTSWKFQVVGTGRSFVPLSDVAFLKTVRMRTANLVFHVYAPIKLMRREDDHMFSLKRGMLSC